MTQFVATGATFVVRTHAAQVKHMNVMFGVYYEVKRPTKNELEWEWVKEAQAKSPDLSGKDLLKKRFAVMR